MEGKYELKKSSDWHYYFNLKTANNELLLTGETYDTKPNVLEAIVAVRLNAPCDERYERKIASNSQPHFTLQAANGQPLGKSELYPGFVEMENGLAVVKAIAVGAPIEDLTVESGGDAHTTEGNLEVSRNNR